MNRSLILLFIFVLAVSLRIAAFSEGRAGIESDEKEYDRLATGIMTSKTYTSAAGAPTSHRPPLYPAILALIYAAFGHSYFAVKVIQALASSATVILIYLIADRIFNRTTAILASFFASFYMPFIVCARLLYTETLFIFFLFLITYLILTIKGPGIGRFILLGLLCGALTLLKSTGFILIFIAATAFIVKVKDKRAQSNKIILSILALVLSFMLVIVPWTIRNYMVHKKIVFISTNAGINIYQATIKTPGNIFALDPDDPVEIRAAAANNEVERNNIYMAAAISFYREYPLRALKMLLVRFLFFWNVIDWEVMGGSVINYQYIFIMPFAVMGTLYAVKFRKDVALILALILSFLSFVLLFQGTSRYRMPIDGFLIILGCYGIYEFTARRKKRIYSVVLTGGYFFMTYLLYKYSIYTKYFIKALMERMGLWW